VCRGCILVGPSRFFPFFSFFYSVKNDPRVVARSGLAPLARVHTHYTCAKPLLVNYFVWFQSLFQVFKQTNLEQLFLIRQVRYLDEKMLGVEFQRLLWETNGWTVDCRSTVPVCLLGVKLSSSDTHLRCH